MARDYAKKSYPKGRRNNVRGKAHARSNSAVIALVFGLLLGVLVSWGFYLHQAGTFNKLLEKHAVNSNKGSAKDNNKVAANKPKPKAKTNVVAKSNNENTKFDFYTLLPNQQVAVEGKDEANTASEQQIVKPRSKSNTELTIAEPEKIFVQVGLFNSFDNADSLKARLALLGIGSHIAGQVKDGQQLYRVYIGPMSDRKAALELQQRLGANALNSTIVSSLN